MGLEPAFDDVTQGERELLELYERLHGILELHGDELPPYARRNGVKALAALWQVANGLGAQPGQVYDVGA
jgi:hypothetical protein